MEIIENKQMTIEPIEDQIGVDNPEDAFEQATSGGSVTTQHQFVDGDRDKEVIILDQRAGASSTAPANSGIPSAMIQNSTRKNVTPPNDYTPMPDRIIPRIQDMKP